MLPFLYWYISISVLGWLAFPLAYRLLPGLPDRGYIFSRSLGLLLWAYGFWLLASLQVLPNTQGGILTALLLLAALSAWSVRKSTLAEVGSWIRARSGFILSVEILFLLSFAAMALVRAANPEILGTEKPMELAFINAILNSPEFPPHDPWLSGFAISYYYFGYVMVAALAKLTSVPGNIAFNLGVALVFALSALGAYGIVYNLLSRLTAARQAPSRSAWTAIYALFGPLFVLLVSNAEGFLEVLHARGLFWIENAPGELVSNFWRWLDMRELSQPPATPFSWMPGRYLWWWRASRVVQDYDFAGVWKGDVINEFPVFTFILSDLHPHVLAMPFAFLAIALALNLFFGGGWGEASWTRLKVGARTIGARLDIDGNFLILAVIVLGGMVFLNTWDFPFYLALFSGAYVLASLKRRAGQSLDPEGAPSDEAGKYSLIDMVGDFIKLSLVVGISAFVLYLPFYLGFMSQAGGILPNVIYPTRGAHLWVMFATLLLPIIVYLLHLWRSGDRQLSWKGFALAAGISLAMMFFTLVLTQGILLIPIAKQPFLNSLAAPGGSELLRQAFSRRLASPGGWITMLLLLGFVLALLWGRSEMKPGSGKAQKSTSPHDFAILLILLGVVLVYMPEFFYLRDFFGYRINTIFKFYYQAWLLWGTAAAFGVAVILRRSKGFWGITYRIGLGLLLAVGLMYTVLGFWTKTNGFQPPEGYSLDGTAHLELSSPDEMAAIAWLKSAPAGVVAESVGGSYTPYGRVSELSGKPTVLGWDFHEFQWRGGGDLMGSRQNDIQRLYCTNDWAEAQQIISQYDIRYIFIGRLERSTYTQEKCSGGLDERKFQLNLAPVFQQGDVSIYAIP
ncbi:MAG TPA: DUF2298 domain-containing protein [Anaerolineales bacterium]|nr:DUF2298 domain-containing protein [Anaerolineales bacterium]